MRYHLPTDHPPITLVRPEDSDFWAALGEPARGRHAVVIGDVAEAATATVVLGELLDLTHYLDPIHGQLHLSVGEIASQIRHVLRAEQMVSGTTLIAASQSQADTGQTDELERIALPHSDLRVPRELQHLRVTSYRSFDTGDGEAFNAVLRRGRVKVGTIRNTGVGGSSSYDPDPGSPFGYRELRAMVAHCRTGAGDRVAEEDVLDALVEECQSNRRISQAARAGRIALRMRVPLGNSFYTPAVATAQPIRDTADRVQLARELDTDMPAETGGRWQMWTGDRWDDLTATPHGEPDA